jgi:hypothetical protein
MSPTNTGWDEHGIRSSLQALSQLGNERWSLSRRQKAKATFKKRSGVAG